MSALWTLLREGWVEYRTLSLISASDSARKRLWETLRRHSQNLAIWAAQRMLFYLYFIAKFLAPAELELKKRSS